MANTKEQQIAGERRPTMNRIRIHIPERRSIDAPVPNATLFVGARSIVIDEQNLPARLVRLLPPAYAAINHPDRNADAWGAFVRTAAAMGLLDDPAPYDADCAACLRGRPHSQAEHHAILDRNYGASRS